MLSTTRFAILTSALLLLAQPAFATFSIVAYDPETGDMGVAVASLVFGVGNHVPWCEADIGCVATQAHMNGNYGPRGLELLRQGLSAQQVVDKMLAEDPYPSKDGRQVAVVDAKGNVASFTGPIANNWAGRGEGRALHHPGQHPDRPARRAGDGQGFREQQGRAGGAPVDRAQGGR